MSRPTGTAATSRIATPQIMATANPWTVPVATVDAVWVARYAAVVAAAMVLSKAAPIDEPS
jgi:hypothetical protein